MAFGCWQQSEKEINMYTALYLRSPVQQLIEKGVWALPTAWQGRCNTNTEIWRHLGLNDRNYYESQPVFFTGSEDKDP